VLVFRAASTDHHWRASIRMLPRQSSTMEVHMIEVLPHFPERVAIVTDIDWISHTAKLFAFVLPGDVRVFPLSEAENAREWIVGPATAPS
jgi:hypothetical protein